MSRSIDKILIANRGEIALRVVRACRELGIRSVAVYSDADRAALHVRAADEAYRLGPPPPAESYLRGDALLELAQRCGADAIHPGYGFLSENAGFAERVTNAGLAFIGPPAKAIADMGGKIAARRAMAAAGVPVVPGTHEEAADPERLRAVADEIGYPLLIKASGGGGGKGIRVVRSADELRSAWERARSEAKTGFGDEAVYLERYLERSRHIEIQVFADQHGNVVHLGERDCSLQRRHQKILEEAPSPVMDEDLRSQMGEAAVRAAKAVGYVNAGTVEFLVDEARNFYFLEMNTRLQVEHPVTEMVTGIDLVREQIRVAAGHPLSFRQEDVVLRGAAIEVRLCAEEPERGFLPATGVVHGLELAGGSGVRFDAALYEGLEIGVHYDSMLGKLIVRARDRDSAIRRMRRALQETRIGGVATNLSFLLELVEHPAFATGDYHTKWVEEPERGWGNATAADASTLAVLAAIVRRELDRHRARGAEEARDEAPSPWRMAGRSRSLGGFGR